MKHLIPLLALALATGAQAQQAFTLRQAIDYGRSHSPAMAIAANDQRVQAFDGIGSMRIELDFSIA